MMKRFKELCATNVTWGGYLKLCGWSFVISFVTTILELGWFFGWFETAWKWLKSKIHKGEVIE